MTDRPAFTITLDDFGDRIRWRLHQDDEPVARGMVDATDDGRDVHDYAWGHAFQEANQERNRREAEAS